jgi:hypothetical protein
MIIYHQHELSDRQNTIMPYILILGLWLDYGRGPLGQVSKSRFLGLFIITMEFLIHRA